VPDVADLVFGRELLRERAEPVLTTCQQYRMPAALRERAGDRLADPARRAGDDGDALYRQTLTTRVAESVRPPTSSAIASSTWRPGSTKLVLHEAEKTSDAPLRSTSICFPSARKRTDRTRLVELATTTRPAVFPTHVFAGGVTQVSAGPCTPVIDTALNFVFGRMSSPT